jgi:hypothetical protein
MMESTRQQGQGHGGKGRAHAEVAGRVGTRLVTSHRATRRRGAKRKVNGQVRASQTQTTTPAGSQACAYALGTHGVEPRRPNVVPGHLHPLTQPQSTTLPGQHGVEAVGKQAPAGGQVVKGGLEGGHAIGVEHLHQNKSRGVGVGVVVCVVGKLPGPSTPTWRGFGGGGGLGEAIGQGATTQQAPTHRVVPCGCCFGGGLP